MTTSLKTEHEPNADDVAGRSKAVPRIYPALIIAAVSVGVYYRALFADFVYDDYAQIIENYALRDLGNLPRVFVEDVWSFMGGGQSNYYRPFMHVMYMINYALFGLRPWGFHLVNILVHAGVSVLVFFTSLRLFALTRLSQTFVPSFLAGLLFAAHPVHTEAVTWVACFPELSYTLFSLWSLSMYMRATAKEGVVSPRRYSLSLVLFVLAALSKETALALPLLLVAYDYCRAQGPFRPLRHVLRYLPFLAAALFYLAMRSSVLSGFAPVRRHADLNVYEYFINIFPLFARYLEKLVWPLDLKVYYVFHPISSLLTTVGAVSLAVTLLFSMAALAAAWKSKPVFFGLITILVPLLPVLYIPALGENTFTERYLYLPSFGFVFLIAVAAAWLLEKKPQALGGIVAVILAIVSLYTLGTLQRNAVWQSELTLWLDAVEKSPDGVLPRNQLGNAYWELGELDKALEQYQIALQLKPDFADAHTNIGLLFIRMGRTREALDYFLKALRLKPAAPEAHNNIGVAYARLGMLDKAAASFRESLRLNPQQPGVYNNLGDAYEKAGMLDKAIREYHNALQVQANNSDAYNHLGIAYAKKGMMDEAIRNFQSALQINPSDPDVHDNLARAYAMKGLPGAAAEHRQKAMSLRGRR